MSVGSDCGKIRQTLRTAPSHDHGSVTLCILSRGRHHATGYGSRDAVIGPVSGNARASAIEAQPVPAAEIH
jgi:hypothetical protein